MRFICQNVVRENTALGSKDCRASTCGYTFTRVKQVFDAACGTWRAGAVPWSDVVYVIRQHFAE